MTAYLSFPKTGPRWLAKSYGGKLERWIRHIMHCLEVLLSGFKSRAALQTENLALRHQLCVYKRSIKRAKVEPTDRVLRIALAKAWAVWKDALIFARGAASSYRVVRPVAAAHSCRGYFACRLR